jgi:16S rRNA (cytosine1402-N4)-methyltransferase
MERIHVSVMTKEILEALRVHPGGVYADMTFGEGGHTEALIDAGAGQVVSVDRDIEAVKRYLESGRLKDDPRLKLIHGRMSDFATEPGELFDGIVVDLGVSTRQLLEGRRGFSFNETGPLDMRMDPTSGQTLLEMLSNISERELTEGLERNANLPGAKRLAARLLNMVEKGQLQTTADLAYVMGPKRGPRHPATALFMALRMMVNDELGEVERGLTGLVDRLKPLGRLAVLTFHSNEDRVTKNVFKRLAGRCVCVDPPCHCHPQKRIEWLNKKPLEASREELRANPRSRSAKLRCVEKVPSAE